MPRLIFVNRFFFPDHSATGQILSDLVFYLARSGREIHVVTSTQIYDDPKAFLPAYEIINGVHVHRVSSTKFGRAVLLGRSVDYLSFYRSVWRCLSDIVRPRDIIVAKTDPPLISVVAMAAAKRKGARLINWLQDIFPETAVEMRVPFMRGPLAMSLAALRNRSLSHAEANVVIGQLMRQKVETLGASADRIHVISNWCNDEDIRPIDPASNPLRRSWGLEGKFVLGYSGNLGRVHVFDTVLAAAERLRGDTRFAFLMIGGGKRFDDLARIAKARGLDRAFRFFPYQERTMLAYSLSVPDAHWLSLDPRLEGLIVPSKFYGIAAAGKPVIVIADEDGELARLVQQFACGAVIAPADVDGLVHTLLRMAKAPELVEEMGARAREMLARHFARQKALDRWDELLDRLDREPGALRGKAPWEGAAVPPSPEVSSAVELSDHPIR